MIVMIKNIFLTNKVFFWPDSEAMVHFFYHGSAWSLDSSLPMCSASLNVACACVHISEFLSWPYARCLSLLLKKIETWLNLSRVHVP